MNARATLVWKGIVAALLAFVVSAASNSYVVTASPLHRYRCSLIT